MSDFKEPEEFDSGEESKSEQGEILFRKAKIAEFFSLGYISHDNPSQRNGCTALEQLILFEFDAIENPDVKRELPEIKREIISISKSLKYLEYDLNEDEEINEKALNVKIAKYVARGYVTDDNISDTVGDTSLEQIIYFKYGFIDSKKFKGIKRDIISEQINLRGGSVMSKDEYTNDQYRNTIQY